MQPGILISLILAFSFITAFQGVSADQNKFSTELISEYTFTASGSSTIKQNFSVTNLTSEYLTSNYEIIFPGQLPDDFSGYDAKGKLVFQTEKIGPATLVRVIFNSLAAGKDEVLNFTLTFTGPKASRHDNIWEITIPSVANTDNISNYSLKLNIPPEMGLLAYSSLAPGKPEVNQSGNVSYNFTDPLAKTNGLSAVFGQFQTWGFHLNYQLENQSDRNTNLYILLPSDNIGQKISFNSLNPPPENIEVTPTGNWIGKYQLLPNQNLDIEVLGQIRLSAKPSADSSIPNPSIISFSAPEINPSSEYIRPVKSELFYDIYSASFPKISLEFVVSGQMFPSLDNLAVLKITNSGNTAAYWVPVTIQSENITAATQNITIPVIPPFSTHHRQIAISFQPSKIFSPKTISISAGGSYINYNVPDNRLWITYALIVITITLFILTLAGITHQAGSIFVQKQHRKGHIRRQG